MPNSTGEIREGDEVVCASGLKGRACRLQARYDGDIEQFRSYDDIYAIRRRLGISFLTIEAAWEMNPMTIGTVDPGDLQMLVRV